MNYRPKGLMLYSLICLGIAISIPVQIYFLFESSILDKITITNWAVMLGLVALAHASYHGDEAFNWLAPLNMLFVAANNYWVGEVGETYTSNQSLLATGLFCAFVYSPYLLPRARKALMDPKLRWWRADKRYSKEIPVTIVLEDNTTIDEVLSFDFSRSGIFIQSALNDYYGLKTGDRISIRWDSPDDMPFERNAEVVRLSEPSGHYPRGLGIRFDYRAPKDSFV
jgi:hypothetical protein